MDNKYLTREMFMAMANASSEFLRENEKYLNNLGELFQLIVGAHMTSLYNQLMFAANSANEEKDVEQAVKEVSTIFGILVKALGNTHFPIEQTIFALEH